jgi:hypothetical protein
VVEEVKTLSERFGQFKDPGSRVFNAYTDALGRSLDHGVKFVYIASLNDQVVPVWRF